MSSSRLSQTSELSVVSSAPRGHNYLVMTIEKKSHSWLRNFTSLLPWSPRWPQSQYNIERFRAEAQTMLAPVVGCPTLELARQHLLRHATTMEIHISHESRDSSFHRSIRSRDCARALRTILSHRSDRLAEFSVTQALFDLANDNSRPDLQPGFFAEIIHLILGLEGRAPVSTYYPSEPPMGASGREAATVRSEHLDLLSQMASEKMARYHHGLEPEILKRRSDRRAELMRLLGASAEQWSDWKWQIANIVKDAASLKKLLDLPRSSLMSIEQALESNLPFGVTPFYLSLMDNPRDDRALRAQVFPPPNYVNTMKERRGQCDYALDFMQEQDTSPVDLVTRRYPMICILKPFNTCPQICVYCQRNWEIKEAMSGSALASGAQLNAAIDWIAAHPEIHEVLITGGDPLGLDDSKLREILSAVSANPAIERIRLGTRTIVTLPMRITDSLADILASFRAPGQRDVAVVTHVEHPYEVNQDMLEAVERLRIRGIWVYNQLVYTFFNSRRFEAAALRRILKKIGIEPYYTFNAKGKEETSDYRVPVARLLQEIKEEARLLPGLSRTDEPVFNLPRLGKNHLRALQHRDLLSIMPDGARVYEFHPWEKNIVEQPGYVSRDVPLVEYLSRLEAEGESPDDYASIWYYY